MIKIIQRPWSDSTPSDLRGSCLDDVAQIRAEVEAGKSHLYHITGESVDVWAVTRGEVVGQKAELVVCCVGGVGMQAAGVALKKAAIEQGFQSIRYHSHKPSVQKLYEKYGFAGQEVERVYRIDLGGVV